MLNERLKGYLYPILFWSGVVLLGVGGWLFGSAMSLREYLVAIGVIFFTALVWALARKLNPVDVDQFFRSTSFGAKEAQGTRPGEE